MRRTKPLSMSLLGLLALALAVIWAGEFMGFTSEPSPRAYKLAGEEKVGIAKGDVFLSGTELADGTCDYTGTDVGLQIELPDAYKSGSVHIGEADSGCSIIMRDIAFSRELSADQSQEIREIAGQEDSEKSAYRETVPAMRISMRNVLSALSLAPQQAKASHIHRKVVKGQAFWQEPYLGGKLVTTTSIFKHSFDGSTITGWAPAQHCGRLFWWTIETCRKPSPVSNGRQYLLAAKGKFDMTGPPPANILLNVDRSQYQNVEISASAWATRSGDWGAYCIYDRSLARLEFRCTAIRDSLIPPNAH